MSHRLIRVNSKVYSLLSSAAGELQLRLGHRVSLSDALAYLLYKRKGRARVFYAGLRARKRLLNRGAKRKRHK